MAGDGGDASALLEAWAGAGRAGGARTGAPFQVGWCSWYHYFHGITEDALRANLALSDAWCFDVFQLDDGYQAAIGDWRHTNDRFPSGLEAIAADIAAAGRRPGLWLAPFLAAPDSRVATDHPDWLARDPAGSGPLFGFWNEPWGGGRDGFMYALDTTNPEVLDHLEGLAADLVAMGYGYLKLDFTFAPSFDGTWHDPSATPARRVRAGFEAIRRGAGDDAFILGCGVPLAPVVGLVDANRIGPDVAPRWALAEGEETVAGYRAWNRHCSAGPTPRPARSCTAGCGSTIPDCVMLRPRHRSRYRPARTWARPSACRRHVLVSDTSRVVQRGPARRGGGLGRASDSAGRATARSRTLDRRPPRHRGGGAATHRHPGTGAPRSDRPASASRHRFVLGAGEA